MPKTPIVANTINPSLLAFKPRQVLLSQSNMKQINIINNNNNNNNKTLSLKPDQKALLVLSIAQYLERNGLSKTLKKFQSEAQIEKHDLIASSPDLEEIYCKYLETCDHASSDFNKHKVQDIETDGNCKKDGQKKKRISDNSDNNAINNQSGAANKLKDSNNAEEMITDNAVPEVNVKSKEKKKSKKSFDSLGQTEQVSPELLKEPADSIVSKSQLDEPDKKSKDKKKKKSKLDSASLDDNVEHKQLESLAGATEEKSKGKKKKKDGSENLSGRESEKLEKGKSDRTDTKKDDFKNSEEDVANKENKGSKKRKRLASDENDSQPIDQKAVEESKRRKTEGSEDPKGSKQPTKVNASIGTAGHDGKESNGENNKGGQETSIKKLDALANGNLEKSGEKSALQKTMKKQQNGSAEPRTIKPFQRVKVDEVAFTDERLQDNSYWAKDGAEEGYGAKAQEILGQVRGRDFRHEKTKKKRGTYRGGLIDLQSHSIKFNYSDEE